MKGDMRTFKAEMGLRDTPRVKAKKPTKSTTSTHTFKFTVGERVTLKGARQEPIIMNIARLPLDPDSDTDDGKYLCVWHDKAGHKAEGFFTEEVLESQDS